MYEAHFGLQSRPFGSKAEGSAVFSGPQQVETMTRLKKGLTALDAVVAVTGQVGVGKTAIVSRALDTISPNRMAAWVGRMQLGPDEVLQLLLAGFGMTRQVKGTIQRFALFRRVLAERAASGAPVAIVVEDARRIGVDALVELEALTAADGSDATSANIILMGQPDLKQLLAQPELARLNQRTRLRQTIEPLTQAEVSGYLKHCIRVAGGDYDSIFEAGVAEIAFACSGGIPRMINTLCESAMTTAMEDGHRTVSAALMHKVAVDAFGYDGPMPESAVDVPSEDSVDVPIIEVKSDPIDELAEAAAAPDIDWEAPAAPPAPADAAGASGNVAARPDTPAEEEIPPSARDMIVESGHYPALPDDGPEEAKNAVANESAAQTAAATAKPEPEPQTEPEPEAEIPELINDTQPELSVLPTPKLDEAVVDVLEADTESTAIQEQLSESALKAAQKDATANDEKFDLDAALSFETDATNIMEGITANLDDVATEAQQEAPADASNEPAQLDDLPTLTDSMKIAVDKEVAKAKQVDNKPAPAEVSAPEPAKPPTQSTPRALETRPVAEARPENAAPVLASTLAEEVEPTAPKPAAAASAQASGPKPQSTSIAQVSEMTARIAALDPGNRKNDVDAVEAALDAAKHGKMEELMAPPPLPQINTTVAANEEEAPASLPEITLDDEIAKKQEAVAARRREFAAEIGNANSLEEFSDAMAETLFGDEDFDAIAAEVVANPPAAGDVAAPGTPATDLALEPEPPAQPKTAPEPPPTAPAPPKVTMDPPAPTAPAPISGQPESIEDQINTSLTQSLEALNLTAAADSLAGEPVEEEETEKKGGFFSRFRKSS